MFDGSSLATLPSLALAASMTFCQLQLPLAHVHNLPACHAVLSCMMFGRLLHAGMSRCGVQMSLRCAEVAPGAKPSVEGDDGADWCVVDAGKPLHFLLIKLACIAVLQPQLICCGARALARARAYQNVSGFLPDEYALRLKRECTHYRCALVSASQHQGNFL